MKSAQLREQERQALAMLVQAQWSLIMVRGRQVAAAEEEGEIYAAGEAKIEQQHEQLAERIEAICKEFILSCEGSVMDQLLSIRERLRSLEDRPTF